MSNKRKIKRKSYSHAVIARYWRAYESEHGALPWDDIVDWGEPNCMACGFCWPDAECAYWAADKECKHDDPITHWNKSGLEKCHVVPLYLGGIDDPSNIVLLCSRCHDKQPDDKDPQVTYEWMPLQTRRLVGEVKAAVEYAMEAADTFDARRDKALRFLGLDPKRVR